MFTIFLPSVFLQHVTATVSQQNMTKYKTKVLIFRHLGKNVTYYELGSSRLWVRSGHTVMMVRTRGSGRHYAKEDPHK